MVALPAARLGAPERAYLVLLAGPQMGQMLKLEPGKDILVGRDENAQLRLTDDGVSRQHARIALHGSEARILDLGSRNGTFINGDRVAERPLNDGDKIQIGVATTIKFTITDNLEEEYQRGLLEAALRDPLTGAYNRRHFDERLAAEFSGARRHGMALSLLVIDVDHFKSINDEHGHLAGDAVLRAVAGALQEGLRMEDILARYGGEEFVVIARGTDLSGATQLAERLRRRVEAIRCTWQDKLLRVTVSVGVAQLEGTSTAEQLIDAADRGVYQAKRSGRNQVQSASDPAR
jgi:diguanylate cyclase (GGDEF)-like protein